MHQRGQREKSKRHRDYRDTSLQHYLAAAVEMLEPRMLLSGWGVQLLAQMQGNNAAASAPAVDSHGNVYVWDGDSIYESVRSTGQLNVVASLSSMNDPVSGNWHGWGSLFVDKAGDLYGYRTSNYPDSDGEVFEWTPGSAAPSVIMRFSDETTGIVPFGVTVDQNGNIFGTLMGGLNNSGSDCVFEVKSGTSAITVLADVGIIHWTAESQITVDSHDNVYGIGLGTGPASQPMVYEIKAGSSKVTELASFNGPSGVSSDYAYGLQVDGQGNVYGQANLVHANGRCIFEIEKGSGQMTRIATSDDASLRLFVVDAVGDVFTTGIDGTITQLLAGSHDAVTPIQSNGSLGEITGIAADNQDGGFYAVGQNFYASLPWGPYMPPSNPTLFRVVPVGDRQLQIQAPSTVDPNTPFALTVTIFNADGTVNATADGDITLSFYQQSSSGLLFLSTGFAGTSGPTDLTVTAHVVNGVATFSGLKLSNSANYLVVANADDVPSAMSTLTVSGAPTQGGGTGIGAPPFHIILSDPSNGDPPSGTITDPIEGSSPPASNPPASGAGDNSTTTAPAGDTASQPATPVTPPSIALSSLPRAIVLLGLASPASAPAADGQGSSPADPLIALVAPSALEDGVALAFVQVDDSGFMAYASSRQTQPVDGGDILLPADSTIVSDDLLA